MCSYLRLVAAMMVVSAGSASAEPILYATCDEFRAGYEALSNKPFSATDGSISTAINAIADNHLTYSDDTGTAFITREQLSAILSKMPPIDALTWLQSRYTAIEQRLKACTKEQEELTKTCIGTSFEHKRLILIAPKPVVSPTGKACGSPTLPDLSKPLSK